jgi:sec-independent protein translocase protein TatC
MTQQSNQDPAVSDDTEQPLLYHLIELRDRLLRVVLVVGVVFIVLVPFSNTLFSLLSGPLLAHMPDDSSMIAIDVASPFLIPFKMTLFLALFIAIPYVLYQLWSFVAPGLYKHERRLVFPLLVSSTALFYAGAAFAYFVVFPLVFAFFMGTAPEGVSVMTDISRYLDFVLTLFFAFGAAFEVPIVTILLVWTGMATQQSLREKRPYVIVGAFVIGMLLTPPDIISQTLLAIPVWLLFELGVYFSGWFIKQKNNISKNAGSSSVSHYKPMSDDEMETELDRMDNEDKGGPKGQS